MNFKDAFHMLLKAEDITIIKNISLKPENENLYT